MGGVGVFGARQPAPDENQAVAVEHHDAGARSIGQRFKGRHALSIEDRDGLVKPSAGYGVVRIVRESERLGRLWKQHRPLPPSFLTVGAF